MAPIVSPSAPASSSKQKSKNRRGKSSTKKNLIATQLPDPTTSIDEDLIPLNDVVMGGIAVEGADTEIDGGMDVDGANVPTFPALPASAQRTTEKAESRKIVVPPHRMTPLKKDWVNIFSPLTEMLGLQVRMNVQKRAVEIRVSPLSFGRHRLFSFCHRPLSIPKMLALSKKERILSKHMRLGLMLTYEPSSNLLFLS